jgi:hypothetical protein
VPPFVLLNGNPAAAHGVNIEGLKRRGFTREQINGIRAAYKIIYRSGNTLEEAKAALIAEEAAVPADVAAYARHARVPRYRVPWHRPINRWRGNPPSPSWQASRPATCWRLVCFPACVRTCRTRASTASAAGMMAQGFESHWPMDQLTVRGLLPVLMRYRELKGIQNRCATSCWPSVPRVHRRRLPGFNLGLEEQLKAAGIPTMHYIGPQIWAWRGGRIKKIIRAVSHMLVVFPFEEEIYKRPACRSAMSAIRWPS